MSVFETKIKLYLKKTTRVVCVSTLMAVVVVVGFG